MLLGSENCKKVGATFSQEVVSQPAVGGAFGGCGLLAEVQWIDVKRTIIHKSEAVAFKCGKTR